LFVEKNILDDSCFIYNLIDKIITDRFTNRISTPNKKKYSLHFVGISLDEYDISPTTKNHM
jgi:hypothetical protein